MYKKLTTTHKRIVIVATLVAFTAIAVLLVENKHAIGSLVFKDDKTTTIPDDNLSRVAISLDYKTYKNLNDLEEDSDTIILGTVVDSGTTIQGSPIGVSPDGQPVPGLVKTVFSVRVERVLRGGAESDISIVLPGGVIGDTRFIAEDIPWIAKGVRAIMYLTEGDDGKYHPLAGGSAIAQNQSGKFILPGAATGARSIEVSESRF